MEACNRIPYQHLELRKMGSFSERAKRTRGYSSDASLASPPLSFYVKKAASHRVEALQGAADYLPDPLIVATSKSTKLLEKEQHINLPKASPNTHPREYQLSALFETRKSRYPDKTIQMNEDVMSDEILPRHSSCNTLDLWVEVEADMKENLYLPYYFDPFIIENGRESTAKRGVGTIPCFSSMKRRIEVLQFKKSVHQRHREVQKMEIAMGRKGGLDNGLQDTRDEKLRSAAARLAWSKACRDQRVVLISLDCHKSPLQLVKWTMKNIIKEGDYVVIVTLWHKITMESLNRIQAARLIMVTQEDLDNANFQSCKKKQMFLESIVKRAGIKNEVFCFALPIADTSTACRANTMSEAANFLGINVIVIHEEKHPIKEIFCKPISERLKVAVASSVIAVPCLTGN